MKKVEIDINDKNNGSCSNLMDKECVRICEAINKIPGIETYSSCSGHGKRHFSVGFRVKDSSGLMVLARAIDNRYCGPPCIDGLQWFIVVSCIDVLPGYTYEFRSSDCGENAYKWADKIADNIEDTLGRDNVLKYYGVGEQK